MGGRRIPFQENELIADSNGTRCVVYKRIELPAVWRPLLVPDAVGHDAPTYMYELVDVDMGILRLLYAERDWMRLPENPVLVHQALEGHRARMMENERLVLLSQQVTEEMLQKELSRKAMMLMNDL